MEENKRKLSVSDIQNQETYQKNRNSDVNRNRQYYILDEDMMCENHVQKQTSQQSIEKLPPKQDDNAPNSQRLSQLEDKLIGVEQKKNKLDLVKANTENKVKEAEEVKQEQTGDLKDLQKSNYVMTKEQMELEQKIQRQQNQMLKSFIVQKDDDLLIVSQHIPLDFNLDNNLNRNLKRSTQIHSQYVKKPTIADAKDFQKEIAEDEYLVSQTVFNKKKDGSLLDLFENPMFNIHMIFQYLHKQNQPNMICYLINKLYREYRNEVNLLDFYLPQICYLSITKKTICSKPIERFILQISIQYQVIALKTLQWFQAWSEDEKLPYAERAMDMYSTIEGAIVNEQLPQKYQMEVVSKEEFERQVENDQTYAEYTGFNTTRSQQNQSTDRSIKSSGVQAESENKIVIAPKPKNEGNTNNSYLLENEMFEENFADNPYGQPSPKIQSSKSNVWGPTSSIPEEQKTQENPKEEEEKKQKELDIQIKQMMDQFQDKKFRAEYLQLQQSFITDLRILSQDLKQIPNKKRQDALILDLLKMNNWIESHIRSQIQAVQQIPIVPSRTASSRSSFTKQDIKGSYRYNYHGLMLPLETNGGDDKDPHIIVNIIAELSQPFNTKQRAPFKMVVETIRYNELRNQEKRKQQQDDLFNKSPKHLKESIVTPLEDPITSQESQKSAEQTPEGEPLDQNENQDPDAWEKVSYSDLNLDGMCDPYAYNQKKMISDYKHSRFAMKYESWTLKQLIVKANDDVRQEVLAIQLMKRLSQIFNQAENLNIFLRPYEIFVTSSNSGLLEFIPETNSIDYLKKKFPSKEWTLNTFFLKYFGEDYDQAQKNFVESFAGYAIFSYLFNIKDRHNGNILIDSQGHMIHIDFGFFLQNSPGNMGFESAPFKFTQEYLDIMGGLNSPMYEYFESLLIRGFIEVRKHMDEFINLIKIMAEQQTIQDTSQNSLMSPAGTVSSIAMPCFKNILTMESEIRDRISGKYNTSNKTNEFKELVQRICANSLNNNSTKLYDQYQKMTNGIEP